MDQDQEIGAEGSLKDNMSLYNQYSMRQMRVKTKPSSTSHYHSSSSTITLEDEIQIYLRINQEISTTISFQKSERRLLTCGWLLSEAIRQMITYPCGYDPEDIIGLCTEDQNIQTDYLLSCLERQIPIQVSNMTLKPIMKQEFKDSQISLKHFSIVKKIGAGGFSVVYLVRKLDNCQFYAMKVIDKQLMLERDKEEIIFNERNILEHVNHKRVVKLHYAFQTVRKIQIYHLQQKKKLFFVLDFCPGGELYYHLKQQKRFSEDQTRVIFAQVTQGLEYLHSNNIIFRDLKPENVLVDQDGYLKIADFGLSKLVRKKDQLNYTFCGSLEYMAPEMVTMTGHNYLIDYYMLAGVPPFFAKSRQEMANNILRKDISFPNFFSKDLQNLIRQLTEKDKSKRLSSMEQIKKHPWVKLPSKIQAPIKPSLQNLNFDKIFTQQDVKDIEHGPRCLAEELQFRSGLKQSNRQQLEQTDPYEQFANFYYEATQ